MAQDDQTTKKGSFSGVFKNALAVPESGKSPYVISENHTPDYQYGVNLHSGNKSVRPVTFKRDVRDQFRVKGIKGTKPKLYSYGYRRNV